MSYFCEVINCKPSVMATASCSSSDFIVREIAVYAKDITFGRRVGKGGHQRVADGNKKQIIKADGKLEEFCKACNTGDLRFVPEVSACGSIMNIEDAKKKDREDIGEVPMLGLGRGWSDDKQMTAFAKCFGGTVEFHGGSKAVTLLNSASSFEEIQRSLSASAKAKAGAKFFSGSAESEYAEHIKDSKFTQSFYFLQNIKLPTAIFQPDDHGVDALNKLGKKAYAVGPEHFRKVCGNRLITEVHQGAALYTTMQIRFTSHYDKKNF